MSEIHALRDMAGDFPASAIAECLGRSENAIRKQARKWGIDLRCEKDGLYWCNQCMTWRTTKKCMVCNQNHLTKLYDDDTETFGVKMTRHLPEYHTHDTGDYIEAEREDIKDARARYNRAYKQNERVRKQFMIITWLLHWNDEVAQP